MRPIFELRDGDVAGRIGELTIPRSKKMVETPALLPVVNPHVQTISPATLATEFGAEMLITNAYILHGSEELCDRVVDEGLHAVLGFDGAIMTDSGAFQLAEYGEIDVTSDEILSFQRTIGADVATPVDLPTPPDVSREQAEADLNTTQNRLEAAARFDAGDMLVAAPIQGSTYPDLRKRAAREAFGTGLDIFPVGAMVPLLTDYRFGDVIDQVVAAKRGLSSAAPVHLFGAGHPMMFALAVAVGCDLFDSAAYAQYARDGRYLTVEGTERLADLRYFPCACPICADTDPETLRSASKEIRERRLAEHNLYVSFGEIQRIKQAIRDGDLLELVEQRARGHPTLLDGYRALLDHGVHLEQHDPVRKGTFFYCSSESARRPEVTRHHSRLSRLATGDRVTLTSEPARFEHEDDDIWFVKPPFGPYPATLAQTYPLTAEVPDRLDQTAFEAALEGLTTLVDHHPTTEFVFFHAGWPKPLLDRLPDRLETRPLPTNGQSGSVSNGGEP